MSASDLMVPYLDRRFGSCKGIDYLTIGVIYYNLDPPQE
jgi:hypothetical protein